MLYRPQLELPAERGIREGELPIPAFNAHPLFQALQDGIIYPDSKTAADITYSPATIRLYENQRNMPGFDLRVFADFNLRVPDAGTSDYRAADGVDLETHIADMWNVLRFDGRGGGPNIELDFPDIIPGQRFIEVYYSDALQTIQGLLAQGRVLEAKNIVDNRFRLLEQLDHVPNGTKTYFCRRSQRPVLSRMVNELARYTGNEQLYVQYLTGLVAEHDFWMDTTFGPDELLPIEGQAIADKRVVYMPDRSVLNRYWGDGETPRPEGWREDLQTVEDAVASGTIPGTPEARKQLFRDIRAGCESAEDFSERWMADRKSLHTIQTTKIVPVDLNCLLLNLERTIARGCELAGDKQSALHYRNFALQRQAAIQKYCYRQEGDSGFIYDYNYVDGEVTGVESIIASYALREGVLSRRQATCVAERIRDRFLKIGGYAATLSNLPHQWSGDNGWAPHQGETYEGLMNYSEYEGDMFSTIATVGLVRWLNRINQIFNRDRMITEKVNVAGTLKLGNLNGGGGEYIPQNGFGMVNGLAASAILALRSRGITIPDGRSDNPEL